MSSAEIREHYAWIKRVARALVNDPNVAGDLAQEAWLVALQSPPAAGVDFRAWLTGVLRNKARHFWRGDKRRQVHEGQAGRTNEENPSPDELLASSEATQALIEEVHALHEPFRSTLLLSAMKSLNSVEIARQEGLPEGTVRWRLKRARELLAERLDSRCGSRRDWMRGFASLLLPRVGVGVPLSLSPLVIAGLLAAILLVPAALIWKSTQPSERARSAEGITPEMSLALGDAAAPPANQGSEREASASAASGATDERRQANLPQEQPRTPRVFLDAGQAEVRIRLVKSDGTALQGVLFELPGDRGQFGRTNSEGRASIRFRPLADSLQVNLYAGSNRSNADYRVCRLILPTLVRTGLVTDLGEVIMHESHRVYGRVLDSSGKGLEGASVFLGAPSDNLGRQELFESGPPLWTAYAEIVTQTGRDGSFELWAPNLPKRVWAGSPSTLYGTYLGQLSDSPIEIRLPSLNETLGIRGQVLSPGGLAIQGAQVRGLIALPRPNALPTKALPSSIRWRFAPVAVETAADGTFLLPRRGTKAVQLRIRDQEDRWEDEELEVLPGTTDLVLRFEREL